MWLDDGTRSCDPKWPLLTETAESYLKLKWKLKLKKYEESKTILLVIKLIVMRLYLQFTLIGN